MKNYKIQIWYRFVIDGEIEKDFEIFDVEALSLESAKATIHEKYFSSHTRIPFKFELLDDNSLTKLMLYNLTNPFKNLN